MKYDILCLYSFNYSYCHTISFVFTLFNFLENARRIRANDREYNSQFHYAVSVKRVEQIE